MASAKSKVQGPAIIEAPNVRIVQVRIRGNANYVSNNFSQEAREQLEQDMSRGEVDRTKKRAKRPPKDFHAAYLGSLHRCVDGWHGIPVIAFRSSMVRAGQMVGIEMTKAKMCVFVEPDGFTEDGTGLVKIVKGEPEEFRAYVRNANGSADIRARGRFAPGWEAIVTLKFDVDFLSMSSVINLLARAGVSVGVGAGRPFSTMSVGQNWGTWDIIPVTTEKEGAENAAE